MFAAQRGSLTILDLDFRVFLARDKGVLGAAWLHKIFMILGLCDEFIAVHYLIITS